MQNPSGKRRSGKPRETHAIHFFELGVFVRACVDKLAPVVAECLIRSVTHDRVDRRADVIDNPSLVGGIEQVLVTQTFDEPAVLVSALAQFARTFVDTSLEGYREQLVIALNLPALGDVAANI